MLYTDRKTMIVLNDTTKEVIFKTLGPLVEKWSGGVKLNPTSVYGIRRYTNNSWMLGHVDKAVSLNPFNPERSGSVSWMFNLMVLCVML